MHVTAVINAMQEKCLKAKTKNDLEDWTNCQCENDISLFFPTEITSDMPSHWRCLECGGVLYMEGNYRTPNYPI